MREYSKISPSVWRSQKFNNLPSDRERYLFLYLLTNAHQNSAGCYALMEGYACFDLRWAVEHYRIAMGALGAAKLISFDLNTSEVLIERWFRHNPPMNYKHKIGTSRIIDQIQSPTLREVAREALNTVWEESVAHEEGGKPRGSVVDRHALLRPPAVSPTKRQG